MSKTALSTPKSGLQGLSVERRFSTAGVHPFDQIEWEIRDAVIGDPESPAFEQRGVEFPKTWSQNATNIVAQKYFRGKLGSEQRERSVKQMIGRVAGTISDWGREGGYFATTADADARMSPEPRMSSLSELEVAIAPAGSLRLWCSATIATPSPVTAGGLLVLA